jgi:hypothetical protein
MNNVKAIAGDSVDAAVIRPTAGFEQVHAGGVFHILCYDKDGNLKWEEKGPNLVVNTGLQYMVSTSLDAVAQITPWYIGLISTLTSIVGGDTMSSHTGWTEDTNYSQADRPTAQFGTATTANPSELSNSVASGGTVAVFSINGTTTINGAFLTSSNTKGGTTGTLFSAKAFTGGARSVINGDTLNVTYTFSLTGT